MAPGVCGVSVIAAVGVVLGLDLARVQTPLLSLAAQTVAPWDLRKRMKYAI